MNVDSIEFKGYTAVSKKIGFGFDTIKPLNVIVGRNNSGKSQMLDLVEALCGYKPFVSSYVAIPDASGTLDERIVEEIVFPDEESLMKR